MRWIGLAGVLWLATAGSAAATIIHVNADGTGDYPTIQAAIDASASGDTVLAGPGTYTGTGNTQLDFSGRNLVLAGAGPDSTILDCEDHGLPVLRFENGESRAAVLRDMTLRNNYHYYEPTGLIIDGASPTLANVHLVDFGGNSYYYGSGALKSSNGSPLLQDVVVRDCHGRGGITVTGGAPEFERVLVENCNGGEYQSGGGIWFGQSAAVLREVTVRDCWAWLGGGGGVACSGSPAPSFEDCLFEDNDCSSEIGYATGGGGMACFGGAAPHLLRCAFIANRSRDGGGGLAAYDGAAPVLEEVLFADCGSDIGGTILLDSASATLSRVTIVGNRYFEDWDVIDGPSVIHCIDSSPTLEQLIVAFNDEGSGLWTDAASAPTVSCSDFFANLDGDFGGTMPDQIGINGNISLDPLFCDAENDDFTVADLSPCLPANNDCGLMGAFGEGCILTSLPDVAAVPGVHSLGQNYPNPFNPTTAIRFGLPESAIATLSICDVAGRLVAQPLANEMLPAGWHTVTWDGRDGADKLQASGTYFYRLEAGGFRETRKMILLK